MWQNRITKYSEEAPDSLLANPKNWRTHPGTQADALRGVLEDVGVVQNVIANERTGFLIDGHLRVMEALKSGQASIPVTWVDLSEDEEALVLATLDPLSALAGTDAAQLDELLRSVSTDNPALAQMLDALATEAGIVPGVGEGGDDFDATPELEGPTRTQVGELWSIGGVHRLLVGDCTDAGDVARLMGGERANLALTDPPYGVSYADKNRFLNAIWFANRIEEPIANDHDDIETTAKELWEPAFKTMCDAMHPGAAFYVFSPQGGDQMMMMMMMMNPVLPVKHELMWLKNNHVLGRADYAYKHEPILYGWKPGAGHKYYGGFQTSVLEFDRPQKSDLHPTTKPLELVQHLVENSSVADDLIIDWFLGSGTTLIAAHRSGRRCYGMEIEPRYANVILRRAEAEGLTCEKVS